MKILLINQEHAEFGGPGGAERSVQSIAEFFVRAGNQVTFVAMVRRSYMRDMTENGIHSVNWISGVKTILVGRIGSANGHADLLLPIILAERPDVIHTNVFHRAPQFWQTISRLGIPILHTLREYKLMCDRNMFDGVNDCGDQCNDCSLISNYAVAASEHVDGVVGISKFTLQRHLGRGFFPNAVVKKVIPNSYRPKTAPLPHVVRPPGTPVRVGFLGRMHASKGINLIVDVFNGLPADAAALVMAGDMQDPDIINRVRQLSETHNARYIGFVDPTNFFPEIDVLLAPSIWHEPFGRITIEAFAHGVPVITTNRGGLPDIVTHGKTGWVFNPDDRSELSTIIKSLSGISTSHWDELRNAASEAASNYTPEIVGERYLDSYRELIAESAKRLSNTKRQLRTLVQRDASRHRVGTILRTNQPYRVRRPLKIMIVTGEFPKLSETFAFHVLVPLLSKPRPKLRLII